MGAIKGLLGNEHGLFAVLLLIASAVFVGLDRMTIDDWQNFARWIFGLWTGAHVSANVSGAITTAAVTKNGTGNGG